MTYRSYHRWALPPSEQSISTVLVGVKASPSGSLRSALTPSTRRAALFLWRRGKGGSPAVNSRKKKMTANSSLRN